MLIINSIQYFKNKVNALKLGFRYRHNPINIIKIMFFIYYYNEPELPQQYTAINKNNQTTSTKCQYNIPASCP